MLDRIQGVDSQGRGCFAPIDTLRKPGEGFKGPVFCKSWARRLVSRLRKRQEIIFAGHDRDGRNVYLKPGQKYERAKVAVVEWRPVPIGWSIDKAKACFVDSAPQPVAAYLVDGYPVPAKLRESYAPEVVREAIRQIHLTYKGREHEVRNRAGLLTSMCKLVVAERKRQKEQRPAARSAASQPAPATQTTPTMSAAELEAELAQAKAAGLSPSLFAIVAREAGGLPASQSAPPAAAVKPAAETIETVEIIQAPTASLSTLGEVLSIWRRSKEYKIRPKTKEFYDTKIARVLPLLGAEPLATLRMEIFERYVKKRLEDVQLPTVGMELACVRRALKYAEARNLVPGGLSGCLPEVPVHGKPRQRWLTVEEYKQLCAALPPKRADWLAVAVQTGARLSEINRLERSDVDFRAERVHIRGTKTDESDRRVALTDDVRAIALRARPGPLVERWRNIDRDLPQACEKLGLRRVSANDLRRTYCTWLLLSGKPPEEVARLLGHTDTSMVYKVYGKVTAGHILGVAEHMRRLLKVDGEGDPPSPTLQ